MRPVAQVARHCKREYVVYDIMLIMARYPSDHKRQTRSRILTASDRLLKERGAQAASIDAVMKGAGLTVGGFYAHFASKDELERETLLYSLDASMDRLLAAVAPIADDRAWLAALIHRYLHQVDEPDLALGCPLTLLLPEVTRGGPDFQTAFSECTSALLNRVAHRFPRETGSRRAKSRLRCSRVAPAPSRSQGRFRRRMHARGC